jgi:hypothetical protein
VWLVPALIAAAAVIAAALITRTGGSTPVATSHLEVIELAPANTRPRLTRNGTSVQARYDSRETAGIVITLRNPGNGVSVINRARVTVDRYAGFQEEGCIPGAGPIPISANYRAELPAGAGHSVDVALSQQVAGNSADRIAIGFRGPAGFVDSDGTGASRLYALSVELFHDGASAPVDAGKALLAVPFPAYFFLVRFKSPAQGGLTSACVPQNTSLLQGMLALPYKHSPQLEAFARNPCAGLQGLGTFWECPRP